MPSSAGPHSTTAARLDLRRAIEPIKWLAFGSMVADHINTYLLGRDVLILSAFGRLALPLFCIAFGAALAAVPRADSQTVVGRVAARSFAAAAAASIPYYFLTKPLLPFPALWWWPLNILFLFAFMATALSAAARRRYLAAAACVIAACVLPEYWFIGAALIAAHAWLMLRRSPLAIVACAAAAAALTWLNGDPWCLLAWPITALLALRSIPVPRVRHVMYWLYPLHLAAIAAIRLVVQ